MDKRPSGKTIEIAFCMAGAAFGILTICSRLLWADPLKSLIAFFAPNNIIDSSYLMLTTYFGIELITIASLYMILALSQRRMDFLLTRNYHRVLLFLCGIFSLLALSISINRVFDPDEFEHIHSAWYIAEGYVPYTDFFQHHHPLLWYALAPFLRAFGYTVSSLVMIRMFMFFLTMGIAYSTYRLSQKISGSKEAGLFTVILLLSVVMFVEKSIEIRPDVPQVFFGMVSVYALISYFRSGELKYIVISSLAASVSFIFLQKTIFLLAAYAVIFIGRFLRGKISFATMVYFVVCFSLPVSIYFIALRVISGSLSTYFITNVVLNTDPSMVPFSPFVHLKAALVLNGVFWLLSLISLAYTLLSRRVNEEMRTVAFIACVLLVSLFIVKHPYEQYFMQAIPLLCVVFGVTFDSLRVRYKINEKQDLMVILVVIAVPLVWLSHLGLHDTKNVQMVKADYVIRNSGGGDFIYDGHNQFNLYRRDLHYFWYKFEKLPAFNRLTDNKYGDYDICTLIKAKRPAFISDYRLSMDKCGLNDVYVKTKFEGLYVRNDGQGSGRSNR